MNMAKGLISEELVFPVEFYDADAMGIVWHGNYVKYMEKARCALLDKIGFGYLEMVRVGCVFPVAEVKVKYIRSLRFGETVRAVATLTEYENCMKIKYEFYNADTGELTTRAETMQMAVDTKTNKSLFVCPADFTDKVEALLKDSSAEDD
jgi:acyl-CoA thioester hydrolase